MFKTSWPVLFDTVFPGKEPYDEWMKDVIAAVEWAKKNTTADTDSLVFYGTSQGGGMSIVMGAAFGERTKAICSDEPFLIGFSSFMLENVIGYTANFYDFPIVNHNKVSKALSLVDPLCYAKDITCPVLLTAGELDDQCEPKHIEMLYEQLECRKTFKLFPNRTHGHNECFYVEAVKWLNSMGII